MRTYKYRFTASGHINKNDMGQFTEIVEKNLKEGSNSLINYCLNSDSHIIGSDRAILDHVDFDMNDQSDISAVNLYSYDYLWKHYKERIKDCVNIALDAAGEKTDNSVKVTGFMKYVSVDEGIPEILYHITERKKLDRIMEEGLMPKRGPNDWNNRKGKSVFMTEEKFIAPWLGILKHLDDPVILKINTKDISGITQGRTFQDRSYVDGYIYGEYRSFEPMPASAVKEMKPDDIKQTCVTKAAVKQMQYLGCNDSYEIIKCIDRLKEMNVIDESYYKHIMDTYKNNQDDACKKETEKETDTDEGMPWDNDFADAIDSMDVPYSLNV